MPPKTPEPETGEERKPEEYWQSRTAKTETRKQFDEFVESAMKREPWTPMEFIRNMDEEYALANAPQLILDAVQKLYRNSFHRLMLDWVRHTANEEVRDGLAHIISERHLKNSEGVWTGRGGLVHVQEAVDERIAWYCQVYNIERKEALKLLEGERFNEPNRINTSLGVLEYDVQTGMRCAFNGAPLSSAVEWYREGEVILPTRVLRDAQVLKAETRPPAHQGLEGDEHSYLFKDVLPDLLSGNSDISLSAKLRLRAMWPSIFGINVKRDSYDVDEYLVFTLKEPLAYAKPRFAAYKLPVTLEQGDFTLYKRDTISPWERT